MTDTTLQRALRILFIHLFGTNKYQDFQIIPALGFYKIMLESFSFRAQM